MYMYCTLKEQSDEIVALFFIKNLFLGPLGQAKIVSKIIPISQRHPRKTRVRKVNNFDDSVSA